MGRLDKATRPLRAILLPDSTEPRLLKATIHHLVSLTTRALQ